jgi:CRP/FNR family transcriptional regulator
MKINDLGKKYNDGEIIITQGETGDYVYVVQEGLVEIVKEYDSITYQIAVLNPGEFFGEMAVFEHAARAATARALGAARVLTISKAHFMKRIKEDPSLAFHLVETMSSRVRALGQEIVELRGLLSEHCIPADIGTARVHYVAA